MSSSDVILELSVHSKDALLNESLYSYIEII